MHRLANSRRSSKKAGSLDDSASDSGKILSYQRMPQDKIVKPIPADGTAELSCQPVASPPRGKHRARVVTDPSYRNGFANGRSDAYSGSETSRSRLSSANLEQNHQAYRNHPHNLDYHGESSGRLLHPCCCCDIMVPSEYQASMLGMHSAKDGLVSQLQNARGSG